VCFRREEEKFIQDLVDTGEGKWPLGRPGREWNDIKMDNKALGLDGVDWINLLKPSGNFMYHQV
jgi:hypothetical protein